MKSFNIQIKRIFCHEYNIILYTYSMYKPSYFTFVPRDMNRVMICLQITDC